MYPKDDIMNDVEQRITTDEHISDSFDIIYRYKYDISESIREANGG